MDKDLNTKDLETYIVYLNLDTKDRVACPHNQVYPHIKPVPYQIIVSKLLHVSLSSMIIVIVALNFFTADEF